MYVREGIGLVLLLLGLMRATLLVAHSPVLSYDQQPDRTSACLVREAAKKADCYPGTEVLLGHAVMALTGADEGSTVPVRRIAYAKLALLFITAALIAWALYHHWVASIVHGAIFLLVLTDPVVTLWFNTLHTEFFVIWGLYATIAATCSLALADRGALAMWLVLGLGVGALAFAREQYALLPAALVVVAWPWLWYRSRHATVVVFGIALVSGLISFGFMPRPDTVQKANRVNAYLGLVAHSSSDATRTLARLNLPDRCSSMLGASWSRQRGDNVEQSCPEAFRLSSLSFLRLASAEPETLARSLARTLPAVQSVQPSARASPWWAYSPLVALSSVVPTPVFVALALVAFLVAPLALLVAIAWARPSSADIGVSLLLGMLLGGTILFAFVSTAFGVGLEAAAVHFLPGSLALYALLIAALAGLPLLPLRWVGAPWKRSAMEAFVAVAAVAIVAVACWIAVGWIGGEPLAVGTVDQPQGRQASAEGMQVAGWALDPAGVESVQVQLGKLSKPARYGEPRAEVKPAYPGYPDAGAAGFKLDLTKDELAQAGAPGDLPMRVLVKGKGGATTQIDQRMLTVQ